MYACLILPFPPSVNNLFEGKARRYPSKTYRRWRDEALAALGRQLPWPLYTKPVRLTLAIGRPDKRRRDVSNLIKAPEDILVAAGILKDDELVHDVRAYWCPDVVGCRVEIEGMEAA